MSAEVNYEVEYNNRARVPENPAIIAGWSRDAAAYREAHQADLKVIRYGTGERNRIDLAALGRTARLAPAGAISSRRRRILGRIMNVHRLLPALRIEPF